MLILFLEKAYISYLPEDMTQQAMELLFRFVKKKARQVGACFISSTHYKKWNPEGMVLMELAMFISKSKGGKQYLDSLGGANTVNQEGSYKRYFFLVEKQMT